MGNRNEAFGRLLTGAINSVAAYEGKTAAAIEDELGKLIGVTGKTVQRYKAGYLPPDPEAIIAIARVAVRRSFLGREWLQRFLHAARYPFVDQVVDVFTPAPQVYPRPPRVYQNLPAPTYSQFVMRTQPFGEAVDGLGQRSAVVLIVGLGGNGKTSLARELAARSLGGDDSVPSFDAVVWVSDKDRPGTTNLSIVLDEIARTLDYPGFTQFEHYEKRREVEQLLRRQRVLVVVDNYETITDGALLAWLLRLPEPSKAIVTSREYGREFRRNCWPVELRGMSDAEALTFIGHRLRVLRMDSLVESSRLIEPLVIATGGNPKAIELALGVIKHELRPLPDVLNDLYAARGEIFEDLFSRAWGLLDEAARYILGAMTLFATSASGESLAAVSAVQGYSFDRALERLTDLSLVDVRQASLDLAPRYALHPLVRAFAARQLTADSSLEAAMRERWIQWYIQLTSRVGFCWQDLSLLKCLDPEQETIHAVIEWAIQRGRHHETLELYRGVGYYYYIEGLWDKRPPINLIGAESARMFQDRVMEIVALAYHVQVLSKQGNTSDVGSHIARLESLAAQVALPAEVTFEVQHALALAAMTRQDIAGAERIWRACLPLAQRIDIRAYIANRRWLATCHARLGNAAEARRLLHESLADARDHQYTRGIVSIQMKLASLALDQGDLDAAAAILDTVEAHAHHQRERRHAAEFHQARARLATLRSDDVVARAELLAAIDLFERLGMRQELTVARADLASLP